MLNEMTAVGFDAQSSGLRRRELHERHTARRRAVV
jgi:hypothetical protein